MDLTTTENGSILSERETAEDFRRNDLQTGFLPSIILPEIYRGKSGKVLYPEYTPEAKALHWVLGRLAGWDLPGKAHVEEYFRGMYRRNFRPRTYASALIAIYDFLSGVRASGKTCLEEISKRDIEAFIEHEQDRHLMLSTVRTKLHCVNAFLGYAIDTGVVRAEVLARRIRLKKPETLPRAMDPDDVKQFISGIDNPRDRAMIMVLLRTGMRIGELLNTKMNDLHLKDRKIDIYEGEKNRQGRVVYLSDDAMDALKVWLKIRDVRPEFLFFAQGRKSMAYSTARLIFEQYVTKAGLIPFLIH